MAQNLFGKGNFLYMSTPVFYDWKTLHWLHIS